MALDSDSFSRKWQITINNPTDKGYTHDWIKEILKSFKSLVYWCMSDEIGEEGTYHTHLYIAFKTVVRFSTIKKTFNGGHFESVRGTSKENKEYIFKEGKWVKDKKAETNLIETHEEGGEMPMEKQGMRKDLETLYGMLKDDISIQEILESNPNYLFDVEKIEKARQTLREAKFGKEKRELEVTYVYGGTGLGKTHDIMEKYKGDVCHITDYTHPFDAYYGEDVMFFDEFRSDLRIGDMLNYLDVYPLKLPARYFNRVACYTKVFIASNIPIDEQYKNVQADNKATWAAFLRRIHKIKAYKQDEVNELPLAEAYWYQDVLPG